MTGIIEHVRRNYSVLARSLYSAPGKPETHTRIAGLDSDTNKELLAKNHPQSVINGNKAKKAQASITCSQ